MRQRQSKAWETRLNQSLCVCDRDETGEDPEEREEALEYMEALTVALDGCQWFTRRAAVC